MPIHSRVYRLVFLSAVLFYADALRADTINLSGDLNDPGDSRVKGPGINGAGASFDAADPSVSVNNVAFYAFTIPSPQIVHFHVPGADAALIDPYPLDLRRLGQHRDLSHVVFRSQLRRSAGCGPDLKCG